MAAPCPTPDLHVAFTQAMHTGTLAEAQAALAALFTSVGDQAGASWAAR